MAIPPNLLALSDSIPPTGTVRADATRHKVVPWWGGVPPVRKSDDPILRFALILLWRPHPRPGDRDRGCLVMQDEMFGGGGHPILRSYDGHVHSPRSFLTGHSPYARFEFLPPLSVVEALAESLGLTLVWPDVAEGDEPSGQEDAA